MTKTPTLEENSASVATTDFEAAVEHFYAPLYRFALKLAGNSTDGSDLTQETFRVLLLKGGQIRDTLKLKSWLFTTLYRRFLQRQRHQKRFPACELEELEEEPCSITAEQVDKVDAQTALQCLRELEDRYREPLMLFYLEDQSYREIAATLRLPVGTVMSRLARGKLLLRRRLERAILSPDVAALYRKHTSEAPASFR